MRPLIAGAVLLLLGCSAKPSPPRTETPFVPLPPFASAVESFSAGPRHLERFFELDGKHSFPEVIAFYESFATQGGWFKVRPDEEPWSADSWQEFLDPEGRAVRQFTVHWASPSRSWSLRLAIRIVPDDAWSGGWVIVNEFSLLAPPEWRDGGERR